jgi:hypothetical protein
VASNFNVRLAASRTSTPVAEATPLDATPANVVALPSEAVEIVAEHEVEAATTAMVEVQVTPRVTRSSTRAARMIGTPASGKPRSMRA